MSSQWGPPQSGSRWRARAVPARTPAGLTHTPTSSPLALSRSLSPSVPHPCLTVHGARDRLVVMCMRDVKDKYTPLVCTFFRPSCVVMCAKHCTGWIRIRIRLGLGLPGFPNPNPGRRQFRYPALPNPNPNPNPNPRSFSLRPSPCLTVDPYTCRCLPPPPRRSRGWPRIENSIKPQGATASRTFLVH